MSSTDRWTREGLRFLQSGGRLFSPSQHFTLVPERSRSPRPALASLVLNGPSSPSPATARPLQKEVRTITGGGTQSPTITIPTGEASFCLLFQQQLISVYSRCPP
ncbi:hypothetical protein AVEN_107350-1 [Araneus ventricosus]|uniref:Uncharacterized protein n=1 Tax=Araneus ventricosus TaxID=182803 RepID=A0A4Y2RUJ4_ARAVE|nr:hypothetical protein AVEN_107350-1 [Araneus ventricosus]